VFETVRQAIMDNVLAPGEPVTEPRLAERLNVSKTPVREALLRLRQIGLIEQDEGRGLRVVQLTADGVRHTYEIREALESFTARRAAEKATDEDCKLILAAARRSLEGAQQGDDDEYEENNRLMHRLIADLSENPRITQMIEDAEAVIATLLRRDFPAGHGTAGGEAHVRIASAIAARDSEGAAREMSAHIRQVRSFSLASLPPSGSPN
jgi:DNA-binding GntR family transcriptional regulator